MPVWLFRVLLVLVLGYGFVISFQGVARYWHWGHDGFNGAAFSQAARNTLRHGVIYQALYHFGPEEPSEAHLYGDHPQLLHWHLVASRALLPDAEWASRIVPAVYSFLTLVLLFLLVRRLAGGRIALFSTALYTLIPLNQIFANMVDHEQGGLFWCLFLIHAYCRWFEQGGWKYLLLCLVGVTCAVQFDWPGYYLAFFLAGHALLTGLRRGSGWISWRPEYTWISLFSLVVLINFFGFFAWIYWMHGSLDTVFQAFVQRKAGQSGYLSLLWSRSLDLHGPLLLSLLATWPLVLAWRVAKRQLGLVDLIPVLFVLMQLIHSGVFQQAGRVHCYWVYYLGPTIAVGGGQVLEALGRLLSARGRLVRWRKLGWAVMVGAVVVGQLLLATRLTSWGRRSGSAAYSRNYSDQFDELVWAEQLGKRFDRTRVHYLLHSSIHRPRVEFSYYLNAPSSERPHLVQGKLSLAVPGMSRGVEAILLADLRHLAHAKEELAYLSTLAQRYQTLVWNRRFVAVDTGRPAGKLLAYRSRPLPSGILWAWLVHPSHGPLAFEPDSVPGLAQELFHSAEHSRWSRLVGGSGGRPFFHLCPPGQVVGKFEVWLDSKKMAKGIRTLRPSCTSVVEVNDSGPLSLSPGPGVWFGLIRPGSPEVISCPADRLPVGLYGLAHRRVQGLGLLCADYEHAVQRGGLMISSAEVPTPLLQAAGDRATRFRLKCPPGEVLAGVKVSSYGWVAGIAAQCKPLDRVLMRPSIPGSKDEPSAGDSGAAQGDPS